MGLLHLPEDLRLAHDERIEAGGHAEQMAGRVEIGEIVQVRRAADAIDAVEVAMKAARSAGAMSSDAA